MDLFSKVDIEPRLEGLNAVVMLGLKQKGRVPEVEWHWRCLGLKFYKVGKILIGITKEKYTGRGCSKVGRREAFFSAFA